MIKWILNKFTCKEKEEKQRILRFNNGQFIFLFDISVTLNVLISEATLQKYGRSGEFCQLLCDCMIIPKRDMPHIKEVLRLDFESEAFPAKFFNLDKLKQFKIAVEEKLVKIKIEKDASPYWEPMTRYFTIKL